METDPNNKNYGQAAATVAFILMLLYVLLFLSMAAAPVTQDRTAPQYELCFTYPTCEAYAYTDEEIGLLLLRRWEGLSYGSYYDINAYRSGWGTRSQSPEEVIDLREANRRSAQAYANVLSGIKQRYPTLSGWQQVVLAVTDYNVSRFGPKLERAIASGDSEQIGEVLLLYVKANGEPLEGLRNRRRDEARLLLLSPHERQQEATALQILVNNQISAATHG